MRKDEANQCSHGEKLEAYKDVQKAKRAIIIPKRRFSSREAKANSAPDDDRIVLGYRTQTKVLDVGQKKDELQHTCKAIKVPIINNGEPTTR